MQIPRFIASLALVVVVLGSPAPADIVTYGSGSSFVEKRNLPANCQLDPGAVCGSLATGCIAALSVGEDANVVVQVLVCACAALWCGLSVILQVLCCVGKLKSCNGNTFTGSINVDVTQKVTTQIASFHDGGSTFNGVDLLHAIQGVGGGDLDGNSVLTGIINDIMEGITDEPNNAQAGVQATNTYLKSTLHSRGPGFNF